MGIKTSARVALLAASSFLVIASCGSPRDEEESASQRAALEDPDASDATSDTATDAPAEGGACRHAELTASKTYGPSAWQDATQTFAPSLKWKLPAEVPVLAGNAGNHWLTISYSLGPSDAGPDAGGPVSCRFKGGASQAHPNSPAQIALGLKYVFLWCTSGATPGTVIEADRVTVHVDNGDSYKSPTTVMLALDEEQPCGPPACNPQTCDNHDACDGVESCDPNGVCQPGVPPVVDDSSPCTIDSCGSLTGVIHTPVASGTSCGAAPDACSGAFTCDGAGSCVQGPPPPIDDGVECTADACDVLTGVTHTPVLSGTACGDNSNKCVGASACNGAGACVQGPSPQIDDALDCTFDACEPLTGVTHTPLPQGALCGVAQDACSGAFACNGAGACVQGPPPQIDDSNDCSADSCNPITGVSHTPVAAGTACGDNSNKCVGAFACNETATCVQGPAPVVDDGLECSVDTCDPGTGVHHTPKPTGTACGDNSNKCAGAFACSSTAACVQGPAPTVDDGNVCSIDACDANTGVTHTPISGCDPSPTEGEGVFEKRASLLGRVVDKNGNAVTGATFQVRDLPGDTPRNDVSLTTSGDGSFRIRLTTFADHEIAFVGAQHVSLWIDSPNTIRAYRDAWVRPGDGLDLGPIKLMPRDPKVTVIGAAGGTATDSQGLVEVVIPPGALASDTPINITPFANRDEVPAPLPDATLTTYAFHLEPAGTTFALPATVRAKNTLGVPSTVAMPVGIYDEHYGVWEHETKGTLNGAFWEFPLTRFSDVDLNADRTLGDLIFFWQNGYWPTDSQTKCGYSSLGVANGALRQELSLPGTTRRGRSSSLTFNYDSGLAGSRRFDHGALAPLSLGSAPKAGFSVELASGRGSTACVPRGSVAAGGSANGCSVGACVLATVVVAPVNFRFGLGGSEPENTQTLDPSQSEVETGTFVDVPLDDNAQPVGPGFLRRSMSMTVGASTACAASAGQKVEFGIDRGGPGIPVSLQPGAIANISQRVFLHHRHNSPFGAGWGISEVDRVYEESPDHFILVNGDGDEEEFVARAEIKPGFTFPNSGAKPVFAHDRTTGETFALTAQGELVKVNTDLSTTTIQAGLSLPGRAFDLAVAYVNSQRVFVAACASGLVTINGAQVSTIKTRAAGADTAFNQSHVAARGDLAYYVSGDEAAPQLYKVRLSDPSPTALPISTTVNGDQRLDPTFPLAQVQFAAPTGLALTSTGDLYVADRFRNAVYRIAPDGQGEIGPTSVVRRAIGAAGANIALPIGERFEGMELPVSAPLYVSASDDDTLIVATLYGALQYRRTQNGGDATWLVYNDNTPQSDLLIDWNGGGIGDPGNVVAVGPRAFIFNRLSTVTVLDTPTKLASRYAPTRTLEKVGSSYFLVDALAGTREAFDSVGRMTESGMRTGENLLLVQYVDAVGGRISSITDNANGTWSFTYQGGKLLSVTDPSSRVTSFSVDGFGDLTKLTTAAATLQAEDHVFTYIGHKMTSKTSPAGQSTTYDYSPNGNISKATKPTGEMTTITASMDAPPSKDVNGLPIRTGTYTDPFGVTHTLTTNGVGMVDKDVWTADATTYTRVTSYDPFLYANVPNTGAIDTRRNKIYRPAYHVLNGVQEDRFIRWDVRGRVYRIGNSSNPVQDFIFLSYDANDHLIRVDGPGDQDVTRWEYESTLPEARLKSVFRPLFSGGNETNTPAQQTQWFYLGSDPFLPSAMKTHGVQYDYGYDGKGNLQTVHDGLLLGTTAYTRDAKGNVTLVESKDAANVKVTSSSFDFDAQDRLIASRDNDGNQTDYGYTNQGCGCTEGDKLTSVHTPDLPSGLKWELRYDPTSGRLAKLIDPDLHETSMGYTPTTNRLSQVTDANSHSASMGYDQLGRLSSAADALSRTYTRAYPVPAGGIWTGASVLAGSPNLTPAPTDLTAPLADGQYQIGIARYQDRSNPAQLSFYRDATFELSYGMSWDNAKRLTRRADRAGTPITTGATLPAGAAGFDDQTFSYDQRTAGAAATRTDAQYGAFLESTTATYNDELDVVSRVGDGQRLPRVQAESFQRAAAGRVTQISRTISTFMNEPSQLQGVPAKSGSPLTVVVPAQQYQYDANGRVKQWTDADGIHDVFYDTRGLLAKITTQGEGDYVFTYDAVGRNARLVYPGGFQRDQVFDHEGRLTERCYSHPSGPTRCYRASYDAVGNPVTLEDPEDTDAITYDALDRLSSIQRASATQTFSYNALGALHDNGGTLLDDQRPKLAGGGNAPSAVPATYNSLPVTLDGGGRITLLDGVTLKYSRRGALIGATKVTGPTTQGEWYGHDPEGRRISRTVSSTTSNVTTFPDEEYFAWSGPNVVARLDKTGAVRQGFLFEGIDKPLRLRDTASGFKYYYELDIAGNVRRLRRTDGSDAGGYRYSGFGHDYGADVAPQVDQPLRWKARWWSDFAKLYDVRARQWSPELGSFTSIDEYVFHDKRSTLWSWPGMNPILWRDPWGRDYESTGIEGMFLRNADAAMRIGGAVTIAAATIATGGLALEFGLTGLEAAGLAGGALGWSTEGLRQILARDGMDNGKMIGAAGWTALDAVLTEWILFGSSGLPTACPVRGKLRDVKGSKPPFRGEPGSTARGQTQSRAYGDDGFPITDRDLGHPDEKGLGCGDHCHDWGRPDNGGPPTAGDRGSSRLPKPGDPPPPRGPGIPPENQ